MEKNKERIDEELVEIEALLSEKKYETVIEKCNQIINIQNNNPILYRQKGEALYGLKKYKEALKELNKAINLDNKNANLYNLRGRIYYQLKEYKEALKDLDELTEKFNSKDIGSYFLKSLIYFELKEDEKGLKNLNKAIELDDKNVNFYKFRGEIYFKQKKYKEALKDLDKAINLDNKNINLYITRGLMSFELEKYKEALKDLDKAIELDSKDENLYNFKGEIHFKLEEYEKALEALNKAIELNSEYIFSYKFRGEIFLKLKKYKEALEDLHKVVELDKQDMRAYEKIGKTYSILKEYKNAIINYKKVLEILKNKKQDSKIEDNEWLLEYYESEYKEIEKKYLNNLYEDGNKSFFSKNFTQAKKKFRELIENSREEKKEKIEEIEERIALAEKEVIKVKAYLTFADILGWKGIWQKTSNSLERTKNIVKLIEIKERLEKIKEDYENIFIDINLISDTFVIGCNSLKIHNELCKCLIEECLANKLLIRGATSYGEYYNRDMVYLGGAVDEAASWHEKGEEIVIYFTPSARLQLKTEIKEEVKNEKYKEFNLKEDNSINTKIGNIDTVVIDWMENKKNIDNFYQIMSETIIHPEIAKKYFNTEKKIKEK